MRPPLPHRRASLCLPALIAAAGVLGLAACGGGGTQTSSPATATSDVTAATDAPGSPDGTASAVGGFTSFADVIPAGVSGPGHQLGMFDTAILESVGMTVPAVDDDDLLRYLDDVTQSLGRTGVGEAYDGLSCTSACDTDRYGPSFVDAFGYAPLAFDRAVLVGGPPSSLTILQGGNVDPDDVVAAFDGDDGYTIEPAGDGVRIASDCRARQTNCVAPGPRDRLGRGLHVYVDDTWRAVSVDPAVVDAFVARIDGAGDALRTDAPERTMLDWADSLGLTAGQGWAPLPGQSCGPDAVPDARTALIGTVAAHGDDPTEVVYRVEVDDPADARAAETTMQSTTSEDSGCGRTPTFVEDQVDDAQVSVDGDVVTLTATVVGTIPARWPDAPTEELPRGAIWVQLLLRADLPWSRPAEEPEETAEEPEEPANAGTSGTAGWDG